MSTVACNKGLITGHCAITHDIVPTLFSVISLLIPERASSTSFEYPPTVLKGNFITLPVNLEKQ